MSANSSISSFCTGAPSGPVWGVTSLDANMRWAASSASCGLRTSWTPPDLPRPPACIWAFTTDRPPNSWVAALASAGVVTTMPRGTGIP